MKVERLGDVKTNWITGDNNNWPPEDVSQLNIPIANKENME